MSAASSPYARRACLLGLLLATGALGAVLGSSACASGAAAPDATALTDAGADANAHAEAGTDAAPPSVPPHRAVAAPCTLGRATTEPPPVGDGGANDCEHNADCMQGTNGRCLVTDRGYTCSYDTCASDDDCARANTACICRAVENLAPEACGIGNCRVDADCGDGHLCSPVFVNDCPTSLAVAGYYCRTDADACVNDGDCAATPARTCAFDGAVSHWACLATACD